PRQRFAGVSHLGLNGTIPSTELLAPCHKREGESSPITSAPYQPLHSLRANLGQDVSDEGREKFVREGARTIPGREHGGNCMGSRCYFPVFVKGANLSVGALPFSQGDVRTSLAIHLPYSDDVGNITFKRSIIKNGIEKFALKQPIFLPSPIDPLYSAKLTVKHGHVCLASIIEVQTSRVRYGTVAYKQAALNAIAYLQKVPRKQAYLLLSVAPIESHVGAVFDSPYACVTLVLPLGIFDHDILPKPKGLEKHNFGQCAIRSDGIL
ncbi:hypothetical protein SISNIDRAFT_413362, partial [Sistotremastrum niveocremeum HHB9708]